MSNRPAIAPKLERPDDDAPLRLHIAAAWAYPDGSIGAKTLRTQHRLGRLVIERVAGKDYTTLNHIKRMRELCRVEAKAQDSGCAKNAETAEATSATPPSGSCGTDHIRKAHAAALTIADELSRPSPPTSRASTSTARRRDNVIRLKSR